MAPATRRPSRRALRRTRRSWMNIAITATVRTLSGPKNRSEEMLSMFTYGDTMSNEGAIGVPLSLQWENQVAQRAFDEVDDRLGVEPEDDDQRAQRVERQPFAPVDVGQRAVSGVQLAEHHPLDGPEVVRGGDDHAQRRDDGQRLPLHQRAEEDGELADDPA